jgi:hypothetical protein
MTRSRDDEIAEYFSRPDPEVRVIMGKDWARCHPMICPSCGSRFYGWAPLDALWERNATEPEPSKLCLAKNRATCGRAMCHEVEDVRQWERRKPSPIHETGL